MQGQSTGSKSKVLGIETDRWLTAAVYFDSDYQAIQSVADLYPSGVEITSNTHDFTGNVTRTKVKQTVDNTVYEYDKWFEFDAFGRLQQVSQQITGDGANGKVVLASYTYDELGRTATKAIHNGLETESYAYDMTGRTNAVTSPSFSYALDYEQSAVAGTVPRLDGNISAMRWGSAASTDKAYAYAYDRVGQLRSADYKLLSGGVWSPSANYQEGGLTYDLNGNILSVQRTDGNGENLHELTYTYDGYRLLSVGVNGTASDSYLYDADGNMTFDGRRGLTIAYNTLNLPEEIVAENQKINYIYSASGEKLACDANGSLTYYRSVMVYGGDNKLLYMLTPEGTVSRSEGSAGTSYTYNYFKTDHLGSTRVMLSAVDGTLQASQTTDFYPFGLAFEYSNLNKNKYLFSGKELQDGNLGGSMLEWYDFGARFYDPMLGRWFNMDPAAQYANPYLFCGNSPMMYVDRNGQFAHWAFFAVAMGIWTNTVTQLPKLHNAGDYVKAFIVGALSGLAGYQVTTGLNKAIQAAAAARKVSLKLAGGFFNGAILGASGGAAAGFVSGAGNAWSSGATFREGLAAGFTGASSGMLAGALTGGLTKGITDAINGFNFWNGIKVNEMFDTGSASASVSNYDYSSADEVLKYRVKKYYNVQEGDWGIESITTNPGLRARNQYSLNERGTYNKRVEKKILAVRGYTVQSSAGISTVHISPAYATTTDIIDFKAVVGHELIHAYHNFTYGAYCLDPQSERTAYKYSVDTYMNAGRYGDANEYLKWAMNFGLGYGYSSPF